MVTRDNWKELGDQVSRQFSILERNIDTPLLRVSENSDALLSIEGEMDRILIPCDLQNAERREVLEGMSTFVMEAEGGSRFVIEALSDRREAFIPFITEVLILSSKMSPDSAFEETLRDWKELWKGKRGRLSEHQQRGLFGELVVLRALTSYSTLATNYWTGPSNSIHDFTGERVHIEVKTTTKQPPTVRISQIKQVAPLHGSTELGLIVIGLERGAGTSLIDRIEELRSELLKSPQRKIFEKMLRKSGFRDIHAQYYRAKYNISFCEIHWIDDDSPVLDPQKLEVIPSTVKNIRYDLDVYAMNMISISDNEWNNISRKLVE